MTDIASAYLTKMGHVMFDVQDTKLKVRGELPVWMETAFPAIDKNGFMVPEEFSFLESFLSNFVDGWPTKITRSDYWTIKGIDGEPIRIRLSAFSISDSKVVVVHRVDQEFAETQARQQVLLEGVLERDGLLRLRDTLIEQKEQYRKLLDGIPDILFQLRSDGTCTGLRLGRVGGAVFSTSSFQPRPFEKFFPADIEAKVSSALKRAFETIGLERIIYTSDDGVSQELRILPTTQDDGIGILRELDDETL